MIGENTDGKGFLRGLRESGVDPRGKRVVVLGAGGAARAITVELALAGAAELIVINRSVERGQALVADLKARTGANAQFKPWDATIAIGPETDVLVNATSIGLYPDIDATPDVDLKSAQPESVGLRCDPQSAGDTFDSSRTRPGVEDVDRPADVGVSGHHRV